MVDLYPGANMVSVRPCGPGGIQLRLQCWHGEECDGGEPNNLSPSLGAGMYFSLSLSVSLPPCSLFSGAKRASQAPRRERETTFWPPAEWIHEGDNILTYLKEMDASSYAKDIVARSGSAGFYCGNMRHDTYSVEVCTGKHHGLGKEQVN